MSFSGDLAAWKLQLEKCTQLYVFPNKSHDFTHRNDELSPYEIEQQSRIAKNKEEIHKRLKGVEVIKCSTVTCCICVLIQCIICFSN